MKTMPERLGTLRDKMREHDERVAQLPQAYCSTCGRIAAAGTGTRKADGSPWETARQRQEREALAAHAPLPPMCDDWRRECSPCSVARDGGRLARYALAALIGAHDLSEAEAEHVCGAVVDFDMAAYRFVGGVTAQATGRATGTPWGHVSDADRERLRDAWADAVARTTPSTSTLGACGCCGRATALGTWWQAPSTLRWPDGSLTAFCASCAGVWHLRGEPSDIGDLRRVGVEAATGRPVPLGNSTPSSFRLFAESRAADSEGLAEPWSWSDGLREFIEQVWTRCPEHAPEHRREEFVQRRRDAYEAMTAEARAEQARRAATAW